MDVDIELASRVLSFVGILRLLASDSLEGVLTYHVHHIYAAAL